MTKSAKRGAVALLAAALTWSSPSAFAVAVMDHAHWHPENNHCVFHLMTHGGRSIDIGAMPRTVCMQLIAWYNGHNDIRTY